MIQKFLRTLRNKKRLKQKRQILKDIKKGKAVLELIDNYLMQIHQTRKQRQAFWKEFFKSSVVRGRLYDIIEKALGGEPSNV